MIIYVQLTKEYCIARAGEISWEPTRRRTWGPLPESVVIDIINKTKVVTLMELSICYQQRGTCAQITNILPLPSFSTD
jgi:hypothetical protein